MLKDNINKTAKAVIVVYALSGLATIPFFTYYIGAFFQNRDEFTPLVYFIAFILAVLGTAVTIAVTYFPLKALTNILRILMEMEFNSRKAG